MTFLVHVIYYGKKIKKEIFKTIFEAKEKGIDKQAFERTKKVLCGQFMAILDKVESFGNEYMMAYHKGVNLFEYAEICKSLTLSDAQKRIDELFDESQCSVSGVCPKKKA